MPRSYCKLGDSRGWFSGIYPSPSQPSPSASSSCRRHHGDNIRRPDVRVQQVTQRQPHQRISQGSDISASACALMFTSAPHLEQHRRLRRCPVDCASLAAQHPSRAEMQGHQLRRRAHPARASRASDRRLRKSRTLSRQHCQPTRRLQLLPLRPSLSLPPPLRLPLPPLDLPLLPPL